MYALGCMLRLPIGWTSHADISNPVGNMLLRTLAAMDVSGGGKCLIALLHRGGGGGGVSYGGSYGDIGA